ncbi:hypothetical protein BT96DRAFT_928942, partial [Gymnopus androsaceus JB14]
ILDGLMHLVFCIIYLALLLTTTTMTLEPRRIEISTGLSLQDTKLQTSLKAPRYLKGHVSLSKIAAESSSVSFATQSGLSLLSAGSGPTFSTQEEDIWCIDHRGVLTLSVCLVGKRVAFGKERRNKVMEDMIGLLINNPFSTVISIPLYAKDTESSKVRAHRDLAVEEMGGTKGSGSWLRRYGMFLSFQRSGEGLETAFENLIEDRATNPFEAVQVRCQKSISNDVHVPIVQLTARPKRQGVSTEQEGEEEDWYEAMEGLFELKANDRIDPFVAVYEPPSSTRIGNVTHLRWTGFIGPSFVQSLIDLLSLPEFFSLTSHACTWAPVSYVSPKAQAPGGTNVAPPLRDPTREVEDSWCLIMTTSGCSEAEGSKKMCTWALAESVGKHDTRLGYSEEKLFMVPSTLVQPAPEILTNGILMIWRIFCPPSSPPTFCHFDRPMVELFFKALTWFGTT